MGEHGGRGVPMLSAFAAAGRVAGQRGDVFLNAKNVQQAMEGKKDRPFVRRGPASHKKACTFVRMSKPANAQRGWRRILRLQVSPRHLQEDGAHRTGFVIGSRIGSGRGISGRQGFPASICGLPWVGVGGVIDQTRALYMGGWHIP